jgi:hypothetical protein
LELRLIIEKAKRVVIYIRRLRYVLGFGIQSPSAYHFVKYVINEHDPYYAYSDLKVQYPSLSFMERRLAELYFRISNYCQPKEAWVFSSSFETVANYVHAGCHRARVRCLPIDTPDVEATLMSIPNGYDFAIVSKALAKDSLLTLLLERASTSSILVIEDIYSSTDMKRLWKQLQENAKTVVCFDLYYCGIVLFDPTKNKQTYLINF